MTTFELREKRAKAWEEAKKFLDSHRNESGVLSAEDDATYTRMEADITALGNEIKRQERREALDEALAKGKDRDKIKKLQRKLNEAEEELREVITERDALL